MREVIEVILTILFCITVALFIVSVVVLGVCWTAEWDKENSITLDFTYDSNDTFVITLPTRTYEPKEHLKKICWVRALTKLAQIYEDPNIIDAYMTAGFCSYGNDSNNPHAWIAYTVQDGNEITIVKYDPSRDIYLEPLPEDANLLIPVVPIEPKKALKIIDGWKVNDGGGD